MKRAEPLDPLRRVVYVFERTGTHGGALWWLVLECGHTESRKRGVPKMIRVLTNKKHLEMTAPKRCRCLQCGLGSEPCDPQVSIDAFLRSERTTRTVKS
jgi:hypothetical protein